VGSGSDSCAAFGGVCAPIGGCNMVAGAFAPFGKCGMPPMICCVPHPVCGDEKQECCYQHQTTFHPQCDHGARNC